MTTQPKLPAQIEKEFDELLDDYGSNIYYEGDPNRNNGTEKKHLKTFLENALQTQREELIAEIGGVDFSLPQTTYKSPFEKMAFHKGFIAGTQAMRFFALKQLKENQ